MRDGECGAAELQAASCAQGKAIAKAHSKRSRKRLLSARRALNSSKKKDSRSKAPPAFMALDLLADPQVAALRIRAARCHMASPTSPVPLHPPTFPPCCLLSARVHSAQANISTLLSRAPLAM